MRRRARSALACLAVGAALFALGCGSDNGLEPSAGGDQTPGLTGAASGDWLRFGRNLQRTHYLPALPRLNPPLKKIWSFSDRALIEFPPALHDGVAYLADKYGNVRALRLSDQKVLWDIQRDHRNVGPPTDVTAPVWDDGRIYVAFKGGILAALDDETGAVVWKRNLHSHLESSPIVVGDLLYVGTDKTVLYAVDAEDGSTHWTFNAPAPIKASPSYDDGSVFVGDYVGNMYRFDAKSGRVQWRADTTKDAPGGEGGFYSTPALAYGLAYAARDDGVVFAFDQATGKVAWTYTTDGDVYGSPAVAQVPGTQRTVYIGSYDRKLYALSAAKGKKIWDFDVGGAVPGTATVIGHTVYTSSFATGKSIGIDVRTHKKTFSIDSPGYTPMISDGQDLYLIGYFVMKGIRPR